MGSEMCIRDSFYTTPREHPTGLADLRLLSQPIFASKYSLESSRRDLHNTLLCTAFQSPIFVKRLDDLLALLLLVLELRVVQAPELEGHGPVGLALVEVVVPEEEPEPYKSKTFPKCSQVYYVFSSMTGMMTLRNFEKSSKSNHMEQFPSILQIPEEIREILYR